MSKWNVAQKVFNCWSFIVLCLLLSQLEGVLQPYMDQGDKWVLNISVEQGWCDRSLYTPPSWWSHRVFWGGSRNTHPLHPQWNQTFHRKRPSWDSNWQPFSREATFLTTASPCSLFRPYEHFIRKQKSLVHFKVSDLIEKKKTNQYT